VRADFSGREAQAHHEAVLRRRDVEEAVKFESKCVRLVGNFVRGGVGNELLPDIESVLLMFPALRLAEVGQRCAEDHFLRRRGEVAGHRGAR
jgi:hypothetical protein